MNSQKTQNPSLTETVEQYIARGGVVRRFHPRKRGTVTLKTSPRAALPISKKAS